jgi:hypothetical protein
VAEKKLTKVEFCNLMNRNEEIKRTRKAMKEQQQWQTEDDVYQVFASRATRIRKRARVIV